ncbi:MAG: helix-turn-helix domain-containing protein [Bacteroidota bacterium]
MRTVKRIIKIHKLEGYKVFALFNNGESRAIDFKKVFADWQVKKGDFEFPLVESIELFQQITIVDGTFTWKNVKRRTTDEHGNEIFYSLDFDPIVMYELSTIDHSRKIDIGLMIKQARKELGLTQAQLAAKSGTSKHYISRVENNKSGLEIATLTKIVEGGLGKRLQISIS